MRRRLQIMATFLRNVLWGRRMRTVAKTLGSPPKKSWGVPPLGCLID